MKRRVKPPRLVEAGLSGQEIVGRIRKGHVVRRSCWLDGFLIRMTNERGFDEEGNAVFDRATPLYTHCTSGLFLHFAHSDQPFRDKTSHRDGEGIQMLFADDWEDYGFMESEDFDELTASMKDGLRKVQKEQYKELEIASLVERGYKRSEVEGAFED